MIRLLRTLKARLALPHAKAEYEAARQAYNARCAAKDTRGKGETLPRLNAARTALLQTERDAGVW